MATIYFNIIYISTHNFIHNIQFQYWFMDLWMIFLSVASENYLQESLLLLLLETKLLWLLADLTDLVFLYIAWIFL